MSTKLSPDLIIYRVSTCWSFLQRVTNTDSIRLLQQSSLPNQRGEVLSTNLRNCLCYKAFRYRWSGGQELMQDYTSKSSVIARDIWIPWVPLCLPQRNLLSASFLDQMLIHATGSSLHWQHQEHYRILCLVCPLSSVPQKNLSLHHAHSDANTCNKYNFLTGLASKRSSHHTFCPNMLLMQHTIWASTLFSTCLRRTFCLHHADSDANTCNKYNFLTGMGSRRSSHHRFCSKHAVHATWQFGHLPSSVHASEEPFFCTMQIQTLIHATNTISSQAWVQKIFAPQILLQDLHTTDSVQTCCSCNIQFGSIWASILFSTCLRRAFCLHHADSDANTCNKYNFLTGMGSRRSSHHRFCSKHAVHATWQIGHPTVLSRHWRQVFGLWRNSPDPKTKGWIPTRTKQELGK